MHGVGPDRSGEHAAVHHVEIWNLLPSNHIPDALSVEITETVAADAPILFVACKWADVSNVRFGMNCRFFSTKSAWSMLVRYEPDHGVEVIQAKEVLVRRDNNLLRPGQEHHTNRNGNPGAKALLVPVTQRVIYRDTAIAVQAVCDCRLKTCPPASRRIRLSG